MLGVSYKVMALMMVHSLSLSMALTMLMIVIPRFRVFDFLGKNTMVIFALHMFFVRLFEALPYVGEFALTWPLGPIAASLASCVVLAPIAVFFNRWLPFMIGKKRKPKPVKEAEPAKEE